MTSYTPPPSRLSKGGTSSTPPGEEKCKSASSEDYSQRTYVFRPQAPETISFHDERNVCPVADHPPLSDMHERDLVQSTTLAFNFTPRHTSWVTTVLPAVSGLGNMMLEEFRRLTRLRKMLCRSRETVLPRSHAVLLKPDALWPNYQVCSMA